MHLLPKDNFFSQPRLTTQACVILNNTVLDHGTRFHNAIGTNHGRAFNCSTRLNDTAATDIHRRYDIDLIKINIHVDACINSWPQLLTGQLETRHFAIQGFAGCSPNILQITDIQPLKWQVNRIKRQFTFYELGEQLAANVINRVRWNVIKDFRFKDINTVLAMLETASLGFGFSYHRLP